MVKLDKINISRLLFKSYVNDDPIHDTINWIKNIRNEVNVEIEKVDFKELEKWKCDENQIRHISEKFFSIIGVDVSNEFKGLYWQQPIINQPEIGILGIIASKIDGVLKFLLQAKIEPGNINIVQLSPTLQATKSNFTRVHKGLKPNYLDYFTKIKNNEVIIDQLHSEQGSRFLRKRNRNIIIYKNSVKKKSNYCWLSLGQIQKLMQLDNVVNMDTRTVISCLNRFYSNKSFINLDRGKYSNSIIKSFKSNINKIEYILKATTSIKFNNQNEVKIIPLSQISNWKYLKNEIIHDDNKYFKVIATKIKISSREVVDWFQPMIQPLNIGFCGLIMKEIDGVLMVLVNSKVECGNLDILEFGPTLQTSRSLENSLIKENKLFKYFLSNEADIIHSSIQSEEGGRFYHEQNLNKIIKIKDSENIDFGDEMMWLTLGQISFLNMFSNKINIQLRNLLSLINIYEKN